MLLRSFAIEEEQQKKALREECKIKNKFLLKFLFVLKMRTIVAWCMLMGMIM